MIDLSGERAAAHAPGDKEGFRIGAASRPDGSIRAMFAGAA